LFFFFFFVNFNSTWCCFITDSWYYYCSRNIVIYSNHTNYDVFIDDDYSSNVFV